jgi:hypothetical protein
MNIRVILNVGNFLSSWPYFRYTISYPKFWKPKSSENRKFFHGGRLHAKASVWAKHAPTWHTLNPHHAGVLSPGAGAATRWLRHSCPTSQSARCNVPLLRVYVQVYSLVWACLCLKFYWIFYLEIKSTLVILWSIFIPLKINSAMNNIYHLVLISCVILSLRSWPLIPLTTITKSEKFRFPKRVWSQGLRIRLCTCIRNPTTYANVIGVPSYVYKLFTRSIKFTQFLEYI